MHSSSSLRCGSAAECPCAPAPPPDVRRGSAPPVAPTKTEGAMPRFGLSPIWAKGRTRGIAQFFLYLRRGGAPPHIRRQSRCGGRVIGRRTHIRQQGQPLSHTSLSLPPVQVHGPVRFLTFKCNCSQQRCYKWMRLEPKRSRPRNCSSIHAQLRFGPSMVNPS